MPIVLVIDDEPRVHEVLARYLGPVARQLGATSLGEARALLARHEVDVVLLDLRLPDGDGVWFMDELAPAITAARLEVIIISDFLDLAAEARCAERGAVICLPKSYENYQSMPTHVRAALGHRALRRRGHEAPLIAEAEALLAELRLSSLPSARQAASLIEDAAASAHVLIVDAPARDVRLVARWLHDRKGRGGSWGGSPLVHDLRRAAPAELRAALRDAGDRTVLLTGLAALGARERRSLGETLVERDGCGAVTLVEAPDLGFLLAEAWPAGASRLIRVPRLAERPRDIVPMIERRLGGIPEAVRPRLARAALEAIQSYSWPEDREELAALVEWLRHTRPGMPTETVDLPLRIVAAFHMARGTQSLPEVTEEFEREMVTRAIDREGTVVAAAARLGVSYRTLKRKLSDWRRGREG